MARMNLTRARIGALIFLLASQGAAQKPAELNAVLTHVEGQVTLSSKTRSEFPSARFAAQRQILRRGEIVHVPSGAQATLVCSTETLVNLTGPRDWVLDTMTCGRGFPLPANSYRNLGSYAGRILPRDGVLLLELEPRTLEVGPGPFLLSPRNTAVLDPNPRLIWTQVPDAAEYEIEIRSPARTLIQVAVDQLQCGPGPRPWQGRGICSWAASGRWPPLEPGRSVSLKLGSRQVLKGPLRQVDYNYEIRLLSVDDQRKVQENLRQITALSLDERSRRLLTAGTYAQGELYAEAITAYQEVLHAEEIPEVRVTLGDLYLKVGLTVQADREYRQVLAGAPDSTARAAAELGLGYVNYFSNRFSDARAHFERARELYVKLGLTAEAAAAGVAAERL